MTLFPRLPRREFFTKLALLSGFAALGSATRAKAQDVSNIAVQDIMRIPAIADRDSD